VGMAERPDIEDRSSAAAAKGLLLLCYSAGNQQIDALQSPEIARLGLLKYPMVYTILNVKSNGCPISVWPP